MTIAIGILILAGIATAYLILDRAIMTKQIKAIKLPINHDMGEW